MFTVLREKCMCACQVASVVSVLGIEIPEGGGWHQGHAEPPPDPLTSERKVRACAHQSRPHTSRALHTQLRTPCSHQGDSKSCPLISGLCQALAGLHHLTGSSQQQGVQEAVGGLRPTDTIRTGCADTACLEQPSVVVRKASFHPRC